MKRFTLMLAASTCLLPAFAFAADSDTVKRSEVPGLVKEAILNDPDIIMEAIKKARDKQAEASRKDAKDAIVKRKADLFNDKQAPSIGAKSPDVTLVEFFDYHCGYCKRQLPAIAQLVKEDSKVRVVLKDLPILSEDSTLAARAALAVNAIAPEKYFDYHSALMQATGKFDEKMLLALADKQGIDSKKLKAAMAREDITAALEKNRALAADLGIRGTPAIVIGDQMIPGATSYEDLKKMVADARAAKK